MPGRPSNTLQQCGKGTPQSPNKCQTCRREMLPATRRAFADRLADLLRQLTDHRPRRRAPRVSSTHQEERNLKNGLATVERRPSISCFLTSVRVLKWQSPRNTRTLALAVGPSRTRTSNSQLRRLSPPPLLRTNVIDTCGQGHVLLAMQSWLGSSVGFILAFATGQARG